MFLLKLNGLLESKQYSAIRQFTMRKSFTFYCSMVWHLASTIYNPNRATIYYELRINIFAYLQTNIRYCVSIEPLEKRFPRTKKINKKCAHLKKTPAIYLFKKQLTKI